MDPHEVRCEKDEHVLTVTPGADGMVVIDAPGCTVDCLCCQKAGRSGTRCRASSSRV